MKRPSQIPTEIVSTSQIQVEDKPRKWNKEDIADLAEKIQEAKGLFYPVIIARNSGKKNTIPFYMKDGWGRKRLEAVSALGWDKVTAVIIPHFEHPQSAKITEKLVKTIESRLRNELSDYELAKIADYFERQYQISPGEFARIVGISIGYCYNLIRRYNNIPDEVREAWETKDKLISQIELEKMSHMSSPEALIYWKKRVELRTTPIPFNPNERKRVARIEHSNKNRRAPESKIVKLADAINDSPLKENIRELCLNIIKFTLGNIDNVPGITDYTKLANDLIDHKIVDKKSA